MDGIHTPVGGADRRIGGWVGVGELGRWSFRSFPARSHATHTVMCDVCTPSVCAHGQMRCNSNRGAWCPPMQHITYANRWIAQCPFTSTCLASPIATHPFGAPWSARGEPKRRLSGGHAYVVFVEPISPLNPMGVAWRRRGTDAVAFGVAVVSSPGPSMHSMLKELKASADTNG